MGDDTRGSTQPDLYVGYLPTPARHRKFLIVAVPALLLGMVAIAFVMTTGQRDPGATTLLTNGPGSWTGTAFLEPYPSLVSDDGHTYLVVGSGKFGVADRLAPFDGQRVVIDGVGQSRGGRRVILLGLEAESARADTSERAPAPIPASTGTRSVTLRGEILDAKCYTGAMKPGDGKGHKACAILCVQGGISALFTSSGLDEAHTLPLLRVDGSTDIPPTVLELIGEPVEIEGTLRTVGTLPVLDVQAASIRRWDGVMPSSGAP